MTEGLDKGDIASFDDVGRRSQGVRVSSRMWKRPRDEFSHVCSPYDTLSLTQRVPGLTSDGEKSTIIHFCCFKPLSCGSLLRQQ
jgi:hypothetical protein